MSAVGCIASLVATIMVTKWMLFAAVAYVILGTAPWMYFHAKIYKPLKEEQSDEEQSG